MLTNQPGKCKPFPFFIKIIAFLLCFILAFEQSGFAQAAGQLDISGSIGSLAGSFRGVNSRPPHLRYISYDKLNQTFRVILNKGDISKIELSDLENATRQPLKFFYIGLAIPNESFWVNLRPDSSEGIIDDYLAKTDLGQVLLEADLELKKDLARATFPGTPEGKEYWERIYKKIEELYGAGNSQVSLNTRIWITSGEVIVCEDKNSAYIYKAGLKVLTEAVYLKNKPGARISADERSRILNDYSSELIQELILPKISKAVNTQEKYAALRQVYYSLILAQWFKCKFYGAGGLYPYLIDRKNLAGLTSEKRWSKDAYYKAYHESYKEKEYDLQVQVYNAFGRSVRTYRDGGVDFTGIFTGANPAQINIIAGEPFSPPLTRQAELLAVDNPGRTLEDPYFTKEGWLAPLSDGNIPLTNSAKQDNFAAGVKNSAPAQQQDNIGKENIASPGVHPVISVRLQERLDRAEEDYLRAKKAAQEIKAEIAKIDSRINKRKADIQKLIFARNNYLKDERFAYARSAERIIGSMQNYLETLFKNRDIQQELLMAASDKIFATGERLEQLKKQAASAGASSSKNQPKMHIPDSQPVPAVDVSENSIVFPELVSDTGLAGPESKLLQDLEKALGLRISDYGNADETMHAILKALMNYDYANSDFEIARGIARHIHPKDFAELLKIGRNTEPYASNERLQYILKSIERPSELSVGLSRSLAKVHDWEAKLKKDELTEADILKILEYCQSIHDLLPLQLTQEASDILGTIHKRINLVHSLVQKTVSHLIAQKTKKKLKYAESVEKLFKWGHYFSDYSASLCYLTSLNIAKGYIVNIDKASYSNGGNGNGSHKVKYSLWHMISAVPFMANSALKNLKVVIRRLNTQGNERTPEEHYQRLSPTRIGPAVSWLLRKPTSLIISFLWAGFNLAMAALGGPLSLVVIAKTVAGFLLIPLLHYGFAIMGNFRTEKDVKNLHLDITKLEKEWRDCLSKDNQVSRQELADMSANDNLPVQKDSVQDSLIEKIPSLDEVLVSKKDIEAIAELANLLEIKPVELPQITRVLEDSFGINRAHKPMIIVMPEVFMITKDYRKIDRPLRLGNMVFVGDKYLAEHNNDFIAFLAGVAPEAAVRGVINTPEDIKQNTDNSMQDSALTTSIPQERSLNEHAAESVAAGQQKNYPGGIDLRAINLTVQNIPGALVRMNSADRVDFFGGNVEQEIMQINKLIEAKIIPNGERLKECLRKTSLSNQGAYAKQINNCLAEIFMLEEEYSAPSEASLVDLLQTVVSNKIAG
ncbi:MAG: hypothetical protein PHS66_06875 [Candidatus Omnitrophica bacterium]|nr:hypothetical protein [Candidatus Omnitrophota bacterium]